MRFPFYPEMLFSYTVLFVFGAGFCPFAGQCAARQRYCPKGQYALLFRGAGFCPFAGQCAARQRYCPKGQYALLFRGAGFCPFAGQCAARQRYCPKGQYALLFRGAGFCPFAGQCAAPLQHRHIPFLKSRFRFAIQCHDTVNATTPAFKSK